MASKKQMDDQNERLTALEVGQKSLHRDFETVVESVADLRREFKKSTENIKAQIAEQNKTPWGTLLQGAAVFMVMIGFVGSFYVRDLGKLERQVESHGITILTDQREISSMELQLVKEIHALRMEIERLRK